MASPPFSLNTSVPGNTDVASVFPTLDRSDKDVIQSWFLVSMNTQGRNTALSLDKVGSTFGLVSNPTPGAGVAAIYYDANNLLKTYCGDIGTEETLGVPVGTVLSFAGTSAPPGFILLTGTPSSIQNVSRTTYFRLFSVLGTTWGSGDGSSTFGLPPGDRIITGNAAGAGFSAFATSGGSITTTISQAQLPNVNFTVSGITLNDPGHFHLWVSNNSSVGTSGLAVASSTGLNNHNNSTSTSTTGITVATQGVAASGGSGNPVTILPPYVVMNKIIKF